MYGFGDEDDEGPDPDYGIWGDTSPSYFPSVLTPEQQAMIDRQRRNRQREREYVERTHRDFNRHMIDLFNRRMNSG